MQLTKGLEKNERVIHKKHQLINQERKGVQHSQTFQLIIFRLHAEWYAAMDDAVRESSAEQIRSLFVTILVYCQVGNDLEFWEKYKSAMTDDFLHRQRTSLNNQTIQIDDTLINLTLKRYTIFLYSYFF
jgi:hypothetical protein